MPLEGPGPGAKAGTQHVPPRATSSHCSDAPHPTPKTFPLAFFSFISSRLQHPPFQLSHPLTTPATFPTGVFTFSLPSSILGTSRLGKFSQAADPSHASVPSAKTKPLPSASRGCFSPSSNFGCSGDDMRKLSLLLSSDELRAFIQPSFIRDANQTLQLHILTQWGGKSLMERKP